jgi:hypothetical protein
MSHKTMDIDGILEIAAVDGRPDPERMSAVRARMLELARRPGAPRRRSRLALIIIVLASGFSVAGLATTRTGWDFVLKLLTPIYSSDAVTWQSPDNQTIYTWSSYGTGDAKPMPLEEKQAAISDFQQIHEIAQGGGGRLTGLLEGPGWEGHFYHIVYVVEYTLSDGRTRSVGGDLTERQARNMRIGDLMELRDSGSGQIVSRTDSSIGLGNYILRFTLPDGQDLDLMTRYPPGPRKDREAIFTETRALKKALQFTVLQPNRHTSASPSKVWAILRYTLADGRTVGISEQVPPEIISADGKSLLNAQIEE